MTWVWIAIGVLGVFSLLLMYSLCCMAGRLDEYEDTYLKEWDDLHLDGD